MRSSTLICWAFLIFNYINEFAMDLGYLPFEIKNASDLDHHFLFSYSHQNKIGPSEKMRKILANDLIFDKSRKTIFAQGQEFGYICDKQTTICMGAYNSYVDSYLDMFAYEGELNAYEFVPWHISNLNVTAPQLSSGNLVLNNSEIQISNISFDNCGSQQRMFFNEEDIETPIEVKDVVPTTLMIYYRLNDDPAQYIKAGLEDSEIETMKANLPIGIASFNFYPTFNIPINTTGKITFTAYLQSTDSKTNFSSVARQTFEIGHNIRFTYISSSKSIVDPETSETNIVYKTTYLQMMSAILNNEVTDYYDIKRDVIKNISDSVIKCGNKKNEFIVISMPVALCTAETLYGTLNKATIQEFKKIHLTNEPKYSLFKMHTSPDSNYEQYNYYLATNSNWNGFELQLTTFN